MQAPPPSLSRFSLISARFYECPTAALPSRSRPLLLAKKTFLRMFAPSLHKNPQWIDNVYTFAWFQNITSGLQVCGYGDKADFCTWKDFIRGRGMKHAFGWHTRWQVKSWIRVFKCPLVEVKFLGAQIYSSKIMKKWFMAMDIRTKLSFRYGIQKWNKEESHCHCYKFCFTCQKVP